METLSYGFKKPVTGDIGSTFFPALEDNIEQLNDHSHNGVDSTKLPTSSLTPATQAIAAGSWVSTSGGLFRQLVTMSGGYQFDDVSISFRFSVTGHYVQPTVEKVSANTYYVYTNDNSLAMTAYYGL